LRDDDGHPQKDAEKPEVGREDRLVVDDKEGRPQDDAGSDGPSLMDTVSDNDVHTDSTEEIEDTGEPFEGYLSLTVFV
jgi:hypothetical protein